MFILPKEILNIVIDYSDLHLCGICETMCYSHSCESCSIELCSDHYIKWGCCPGTIIGGCFDCYDDDLDDQIEMEGFFCDGCNEFCYPCCNHDCKK